MGFGGIKGKGEWLAGGVGVVGVVRGGCWWQLRPGTVVKADAAQDSAVFFNT